MVCIHTYRGLCTQPRQDHPTPTAHCALSLPFSSHQLSFLESTFEPVQLHSGKKYFVRTFRMQTPARGAYASAGLRWLQRGGNLVKKRGLFYCYLTHNLKQHSRAQDSERQPSVSGKDRDRKMVLLQHSRQEWFILVGNIIVCG